MPTFWVGIFPKRVGKRDLSTNAIDLLTLIPKLYFAWDLAKRTHYTLYK